MNDYNSKLTISQIRRRLGEDIVNKLLFVRREVMKRARQSELQPGQFPDLTGSDTDAIPRMLKWIEEYDECEVFE